MRELKDLPRIVQISSCCNENTQDVYGLDADGALWVLDNNAERGPHWRLVISRNHPRNIR